jgi:hypothetical protein
MDKCVRDVSAPRAIMKVESSACSGITDQASIGSSSSSSKRQRQAANLLPRHEPCKE